jgi:tRNA1(Val) A37 N6-methylase TrmN6
MTRGAESPDAGGGVPLCRSEVTDDDFLGGKLNILQPKRGYRAGLDAVLLAAAVAPARQGPTRILDVGAGVGTVGLCAARRLENVEVVLLEREAPLLELAAANIARNRLEGRVTACAGAVGARAPDLERVGLAPASFTHVLANPPFYAAGTATPSGAKLKAASHVMDDGDFERWGRFMARMAAPRGQALIVHKPEALPQVLAAFAGRFGGIEILPVRPRAGDNASRIIVSGIKGSRAPLSVLPDLILHGEGIGFTREADAILRGGGGLDLGKAI